MSENLLEKNSKSPLISSSINQHKTKNIWDRFKTQQDQFDAACQGQDIKFPFSAIKEPKFDIEAEKTESTQVDDLEIGLKSSSNSNSDNENAELNQLPIAETPAAGTTSKNSNRNPDKNSNTQNFATFNLPNFFYVEILATFFYIFLTHTQFPGVENIMFYAASTGLTVYLLIVLTHVKGVAHFNPAITLGIYFSGRMSFRLVIWYLLAQMIGGFTASFCVFEMGKANLAADLFRAGNETAILPADVISSYALDVNHQANSWISILFGEIINSIHMCLIATIAIYNKKTFSDQTGALACGLSVALGIASSATTGGGCLNPIRSIMPWFGCKIMENWQFVFGPMIGAILSGPIFCVFYDEDF